MFTSSALVRLSLLLSLVLLFAAFVLPVWRILPLAEDEPFIALHYNIYLGVDRFGPVWHIFFIPILGLFFLLLNTVIQAVSFHRQKTLSLFFAVATPLLQLTLLAAMALIVIINL